MDVTQLQNHIRSLATLDESSTPLISCYLDIGSGAARYRSVFENRVHVLKRSLTRRVAADFEAGVKKIEHFLTGGLEASAKGAAIFSRAGDSPFFQALQFSVPLPNLIAIGPTPNLYHLIELKDNYDRYVILLAGESSARIIGINLGSVTEQIWTVRPDLRRRAGREWGKEHFQDHRLERNHRFVHEQIRALERLAATGGYSHLVLAGNSRATSAVRRALPKSLASKLVDIVPTAPGDHLSDIIRSTLETFLEHEERESQAIADRLVSQIHAHGLAVAGTDATVQALRNAQADYLVIVKSYEPGMGWECRQCGRVWPRIPALHSCSSCGGRALRGFDIKPEMVRLAEVTGCAVEVVEHSEVLTALGGVGCLLRYSAPETLGAAAWSGDLVLRDSERDRDGAG